MCRLVAHDQIFTDLSHSDHIPTKGLGDRLNDTSLFHRFAYTRRVNRLMFGHYLHITTYNLL